jgi:hypothetical protein
MRYMLSLFTEEGGAEDMSPEERKAVLDRWMAYGQEVTESGAYLAGDGLQPSSTATTVRIEEGREPSLTDGPFAETKEQLGGFYLLECKDLDEALSWAKKIPFQSGSVEVRPVMDYEAMGAEDPHAQREAARQ